MRRLLDPLDLIRDGFAALDAWDDSVGPVEPHPALAVDTARLGDAVDEYLARRL